MAQIKDGKEVVPYRGPKLVIEWLRERAAYDGATISAEITTAVRQRMEREAQEEARAGLSAGSSGRDEMTG